MANNLEIERKAQVVAMLCEGSSIRSIERVTGIHRDTVMRLGVRMGQGCQKIMDEKLRGLNCRQIQLDEAWGFIGAKQKTVHQKKLSGELGDVWVWVALDAETKLVPCIAIGDRSAYMANCFLEDLASRVVNRVQVSSDALKAYQNAVDRAFGCNVDYGSVIKTFSHTELEDTRRYSPPKVVKVEKQVVQGMPDQEAISTSYVEKQNHTLRMHCRRMSRLTNAFSKKRKNFEAAVNLHYTYYNFVKRHASIRCTPAMEAGVEKSQWTVNDLVEMVEG